MSELPASMKIYVEKSSTGNLPASRISFANVIKSLLVDLIKRRSRSMAGRSSNEPRDIEVTHGKLSRNLLISETESWSSKMILFQSMQVDFKWCIWTLAEIDPLRPRVPALEKSITIPKLIELSQFGSTFQTEFAILDLLFNSYNASGARLESEIFDAGVSTKELKTTDKQYKRTTRIHNSSPNRTRARRKRSRRTFSPESELDNSPYIRKTTRYLILLDLS